jgi:hypothetical protein
MDFSPSISSMMSVVVKMLMNGKTAVKMADASVTGMIFRSR